MPFAEIDDQVVGSVFLMKTDDPKVGMLGLLYVELAARGLGVGSRLVGLCRERAQELGYRKLVLCTNDVLVSARKIYQAAGFTLLEEKRHHSLGMDLVGQAWAIDRQKK